MILYIFSKPSGQRYLYVELDVALKKVYTSYSRCVQSYILYLEF